MATTPNKKPQKGFEESLWDTANKLHGTEESSEYRYVGLSLLYQKFASSHCFSIRKLRNGKR
jgi:type I restriction enzyme M protein